MRPAQTVHVLVKVHHLETVELIRDFLDLFLLARLDNLYALSIPLDILARCGLVLATSLNGAAGNLSIVDVRDLVVRDGTGYDVDFAHGEVCLRYLMSGIKLPFKSTQGHLDIC
jgi:hypothetical protein